MKNPKPAPDSCLCWPVSLAAGKTSMSHPCCPSSSPALAGIGVRVAAGAHLAVSKNSVSCLFAFRALRSLLCGGNEFESVLHHRGPVSMRESPAGIGSATPLPHLTSTSDQTSQPAEFKHITKRRKRN